MIDTRTCDLNCVIFPITGIGREAGRRLESDLALSVNVCTVPIGGQIKEFDIEHVYQQGNT